MSLHGLIDYHERGCLRPAPEGPKDHHIETCSELFHTATGTVLRIFWSVATERWPIRSKRFQGCLRPLYEATGSVRVLLQPAVPGAAAASPCFTLHYFLS
jgi:hypothetical protein